MILSEIIIKQETDDSITIAKESWEKIQIEILHQEHRMDKNSLRKFSGSINLKKDPLQFQKKIRNEW